MKLNDIYYGFRLLRNEYIDEISSEAMEFIHEQSGARLVYLKNKDDNKVFSVSFRTPPADDTGVPHIIEHSTLCGSRKFPLKEPFVELVKGSLNTFLNAMTYPDKTMYPVASCNDKDFQNLLDVYLDAVFFPAIYDNPDILRQEGWHYEITAPEEPLTYSGVVFNEMKGALSSPEDVLENEIMRSLFPDNTYANESGGNPEAIPQLTYQEFLNFHKKYYAPANCYMYLYGDLDIEEKLAFIDKEYLSHFQLEEVDSSINKQVSFGEFKRVYEKYPIAPEENPEGKTFISYNMVMSEAGNEEEIAAISLLVQALLKTPAAPLRKALIEANLGKDVSAHFEGSVLQPYLSITVVGSDRDKAEEFEGILQENMKRLVEEGIEREILEAALNFMEFQLREADFGAYPKGLIYNIMLMNNWLYDQDPLEKLKYEEILSFLREKLQGNYYEELLKNKFLNNTFGSIVVLEPDASLAAARENRTREILAKKKEAMSEVEIEKIITNTARLKERQATPDSPEALATIPLLHIEDINPLPRKIELEERTEDGIRVLYTSAATNGIAYTNLYFDASVIPQELLPYGYLLADILGLVDTKKSTYGELTNKIDFHTGGISVELGGTLYCEKPEYAKPFFKVSAKSFVRKMPVLMDIVEEILLDSIFEDKKRLREILDEIRADMELGMLQSSINIVFSRLQAQMSPGGVLKEIGELSLYSLVKELTDEFENNIDDFCQKMEYLQKILFNKDRLTVGLTLEEKYYGDFVNALEPFVKGIGKNISDAQVQEYSFTLAKGKEGLLSSSQVQYVAKGANIHALGYKFSGAWKVMESILRYEYFWTKIRVQGGAYGAMIQCLVNGDMMFASYRDPNLVDTIKVFDGTGEFLRNFSASDREMTKYIIGTISGLDVPLTPSNMGRVAQNRYFSGVDYAYCKKIREEILSTKVEDIKALAEAVDACMKKDNLCIFGNEGILHQNEDLFDKLTRVMD